MKTTAPPLLAVPAEMLGYIVGFLEARDVCRLERASKQLQDKVAQTAYWKNWANSNIAPLADLPIGCKTWRDVPRRSAVAESNLANGRYKVIPLEKKLCPHVIPLELKVKGKPFLAVVTKDQRSVVIWNPLSGKTHSTLNLPPDTKESIQRIHLLGSKEEPQGILAQFNLKDIRGVKRKAVDPFMYAWNLDGKPLSELIKAIGQQQISCFEPLCGDSKSAFLATVCGNTLSLWKSTGEKLDLWDGEGKQISPLAAAPLSDGQCVLVGCNESKWKSWIVAHVEGSWAQERFEGNGKEGDCLVLQRGKDGRRYLVFERAHGGPPTREILEWSTPGGEFMVSAAIREVGYLACFWKLNEHLAEGRFILTDPDSMGESRYNCALSFPHAGNWAGFRFGGAVWLAYHWEKGLAFFDAQKLEAMGPRAIMRVSLPEVTQFATTGSPWVVEACLDGLFSYPLLNAGEDIVALSFVAEEETERMEPVVELPPPPPASRKKALMGVMGLLLLGAIVCRMGYKRFGHQFFSSFRAVPSKG